LHFLPRGGQHTAQLAGSGRAGGGGRGLFTRTIGKILKYSTLCSRVTAQPSTTGAAPHAESPL